MESPFFRSNWGYYPRRRPHYDPSTRDIHVQRQPNAPLSRVVNIPVRFVGSERSRSDQALKIQKVLRGFLVRKGMKKIMAIRREVDEIEKRLLEKEAVELIQCNPKEKLKVNETLMNLLINLDSVRGFGSGVRDCRKTVIKKVIGLQEKVDAIATGERAVGVVHSVPADENNDSADVAISEYIEDDSADFADAEQHRDEMASESEHNCDLTAHGLKDDDNVEYNSHDSKETKMQEVGATCESPVCATLLLHAETNSELVESGESMKSSNTEIIAEADEIIESNRKSELISSEISGDFDVEHGLKCRGTGGAEEISDAKTESGFISSKGVENGDQTPSVSEVAEDDAQRVEEPESHPDSPANPGYPDEKGEENVDSIGRHQAIEAEAKSKRNNELLERMADENGRMIGMMAELFEKNEMQTRLLQSLSQRVEHLEKAVMCEKLRKKKRRNEQIWKKT